MAKCLTCNSYFRHNAFNRTAYCESCLDGMDPDTGLDEEYELELQLLQRPNGKTPARFVDRVDDDD